MEKPPKSAAVATGGSAFMDSWGDGCLGRLVSGPSERGPFTTTTTTPIYGLRVDLINSTPVYQRLCGTLGLTQDCRVCSVVGTSSGPVEAR